MGKFLILIAMLMSTLSHAGDNEYGIYLSGFSKHVGIEDNTMNEQNYGVGFWYNNLEVIMVKNSYSKLGFGAYYHPKFKFEYVDLGLRLGGTTGYSETPVNMVITPIAHATATIKLDRLRIETGILPNIEDHKLKPILTLMFGYSF